MKKDTVIGTMGNTHGVRSAAKPHRMAAIIVLQRVLSRLSCLTSAGSSATTVSSDAFAGVASIVSPPSTPASLKMKSSSVGGRHVSSSHDCHSILILSVTGSAEVTFTR